MARTMRWIQPRNGSTLALLTCLVLFPGLAACSSPPAPASAAPTAADGTAPPPSSVAPGPSGTTPGQPAGAESPADSALRLEALLGQHAVLAADLMRGRLRNDEDFAQAANAAVGQNTDELAKLVGAVAGEQAAGQFRSLWADHVTALFNYSRGLATGDTAVRDEARTTLIRLETEIADFFSGASQGRLDREAARAAVRTHVEHLTQQADAYAAGDYTRANDSYRDGYRHTFEIGHTLATTLLPPDQVAQLDAPAWRLRSELTRLLGEHVGLALSALRAGATNSPDFPAAVQALNGNTTDVTAAVDSLFGEPAASQFMTLWADHLDQLGTYAADVGAKKENRRDAVQGALRDWQQRFASFIDSATGSRVAAPDLSAALLGLDDLLLGQVDAFGARDYPRAQDLANQTYPQVFGLARGLADAFGATVAARLPHGGAQTGGGGMAGALAPPPAGPPPALAPPAPAPPAAAVSAQAAGSPSTAGPASFRSVRIYQEVPPPVRLRVPAVQIDTPLQRLGRAADQTVEVPTDFGVAGWFGDGPRPGQPGPAVILGHVDSRSGPAVFFPLVRVVPGAEVQVDRADGSTVSFRVTSVVKVPKAEFPTELVYGPTLQPSLRLVTCGGPFDQAAGSYLDNVIVSADPVL
jgi:Sortase domain